jgi:hypothetical protein
MTFRSDRAMPCKTEPAIKRRRGAPEFPFTAEVSARICELIAVGHSLRQICEQPGFPDRTTVHRWLQKPEREDFRLQYARAREAQADTFADEIHDIADTPMRVRKITKPDGGTETITEGMVEHRRLQIDARKWLAGKLKPKKYGEKLELSGSVGVPLTDDELESRIGFLLGKAGVAQHAGGADSAPAGGIAISATSTRAHARG